jgi:hypothetical protein
MTMTSSLTIKVLLFASAREAAGNVSMVQVELQEGSDTLQLRYGTTHSSNNSTAVGLDSFIPSFKRASCHVLPGAHRVFVPACVFVVFEFTSCLWCLSHTVFYCVPYHILYVYT